MHARTFVAGTTVGAAAMYWLDSEAERRRRTLSQQRAVRVARRALQPNRLVAWRSIEGSDIEHAGTVTFAPGGGGTSDVRVQLSYHAPGGIVGHAFATLPHAGPKRQLDDDLLRLKSLLETSKATDVSDPAGGRS